MFIDGYVKHIVLFSINSVASSKLFYKYTFYSNITLTHMKEVPCEIIGPVYIDPLELLFQIWDRDW